MSRPTKYTETLSESICQRIAEGESLRAICREDEMPAISTVCLWVAQDREGFSERYIASLQARGWLWAEDMVGISDNDAEDADTARDKLRVETRKWLLSKLVQRHFGDKQAIEHSGPGGKAVPVQLVVEPVSAKRDDE